MNAFEMVALVGAAAGLCMVLGGIWLVAKGVITLAATPKTDALTIEWKKQFRMNTQVPGLAFFLVGLLFVSVSLVFLQPPDVAPIEFEGHVKGVEEPMSVLVRPHEWKLPDNSAGRIRGRVFPDLRILTLVINAPGYEPYTVSVDVGTGGSRKADVGTLELRRKIRESDLEKQVTTLPFAVQDGGQKAAAFGAAL